MLKYEETITISKPRLVIDYDEFADSPREWTNLGYFITCDNRHYSPDRNSVLESIIKETADEANNVKEHMKLIAKRYTDEKIIKIYPVVKYEHSGISYSLGSKFGFDYSNNGFYIITDKTQKEMGADPKDFEKIIKEEIELYNKYINGEVYDYILYDYKGECIDSGHNIYEIDEIMQYLPEEFKSENLKDYIAK